MKNNVKCLSTKCNWIWIILSVAYLMFSLFCIEYDLRGGGSRATPPEVHVVISIAVFLCAAFRLSFDCDNMYVKWLFIPVRRIPWSKITSITCLTGRSRLYPSMRQYQLFLTIHPCLPFSNIKQTPEKFAKEHPFRSILIRIPRGEEQKYFEFFQNIYGCVDFVDPDKP